MLRFEANSTDLEKQPRISLNDKIINDDDASKNLKDGKWENVLKTIQNSSQIITSLKTCKNTQFLQAATFSHLIFILNSQCPLFSVPINTL